MTLNERQQEIADTLDGMVVVDAGPGTGKTHTVVERYLNIISRPDVNPREVLLMTFTNNAAAEMEERIKRRLTELGRVEDSKLVMTKTFDAFCLSVVMESPERVSDFFGTSHTLTRGVRLSENETLNRDYFSRFLDEFLEERMGDFPSMSAIASSDPMTLYSVINQLMSRGLFPLARGWFGPDPEKVLLGETEKVLEVLRQTNVPGPKGGNSVAAEKIEKGDDFADPPGIADGRISDESLEQAAYDDRTELMGFVHDVFYGYVVRSISDNRLTFGLNAMFAFAVLYDDRNVRERNSYRYVMIDEFQDTNASQLMISLMIMKEPNLCVVGDWKQGIYGFRYVSIENITDFESRAVSLRSFLNDDAERVVFRIPEVKRIPLDMNYRSSSDIISASMDCLCLPAGDSDDPG